MRGPMVEGNQEYWEIDAQHMGEWRRGCFRAGRAEAARSLEGLGSDRMGAAQISLRAEARRGVVRIGKETDTDQQVDALKGNAHRDRRPPAKTRRDSMTI
ncbi:hypothetical protein [Ralstonia solanacearum]|uniref:hypothetical protein n=1 Tax=Ralstonia solanacearum TaxID=305 RepID=UPI0011D2C3C5|nr:hypothetical protein [Ralstonia solanacearum]